MTERVQMLGRFAELAALWDGDDALPERLATACGVVLDVDGVAITVETGTVRRTVLWATDEVIDRLEDLQDVIGEGPSRDAYRHDEAVVADLGDPAAGTWPVFMPEAVQAVGTVRMHSFPMRVDGSKLGVVSVYLTDGGTLAESVVMAQLLVDAIGTAILHAPVSDILGSDEDWWSPATVHHATGMLIVQLGVTAADALALLRARAYSTGQPLSDVAAEVVTHRLDLSDLPPN